jgi:hypothetical protein
MSCPTCGGPRPPYENPPGFETLGEFAAIFTAEGELRALGNPSVDSILFFELGTGVKWYTASDYVLPSGGGGYLYRNPDTGVTGWTGANMGDTYIMFTRPDQAFGGIAIPTAAPGQILVLKAPEAPSVTPSFVALPEPEPSTNQSVNLFDEVSGDSTSPSAVNYRAAKISLTDGTDFIAKTAVNVSANLASPVGLGGLDIGLETTGVFYYAYVVSDGANVNLMLSLSQTAPNFGTTGYTYYARVGVFRNDGSGDIIPFKQRGREVRIARTQVSDDESITTAYAAMTTDLVDLDEIIPPIAKTLAIQVEISTGNPSLASDDTDEIGMTFSVITGFVEHFLIDDPTNPEVFWKNSVNSTGDAWIFGYSL